MTFGSHVKATQNPILQGYGMASQNMADAFLGSPGGANVAPSAVTMGNYPSFLAIAGKAGAANPLFNGGTAAVDQRYQNDLYDNSMAPQLGQAAEQSYLGGNLGTSGSSTFGSNYMANLEAAADQDAVLGGQQYYTQDLNNFLNTRSNLYTTQLAPQLQADEFNQQENQNQAQMKNQYNLGAAQVASGLVGTDLNASNEQAKLNLQADEFNAQSNAGLLGSLTGGIGGLIGGATNLLGGAAQGISSALGGGSGGGIGGGFTSLVPETGGPVNF